MQESSPSVGRPDNLLNNSDHPPSSIRHTGLGHSFKRKLQNFKDLGRSKSTGHRPHSKSLSDIGTTFTTPIHAHFTSERTTTTKQPALNAPAETVQNALASTSTSPAVGDIRVPLLLQEGTPMTKVSLKKHKKFVFRLDADLGQVVWESKQHKIS
jgi:phosphatidylinositol phospholipase C, delta